MMRHRRKFGISDVGTDHPDFDFHGDATTGCAPCLIPDEELRAEVERLQSALTAERENADRLAGALGVAVQHGRIDDSESRMNMCGEALAAHMEMRGGEMISHRKRMAQKYKRCKKCKELVSDPDNCGNCRDRDPNAWRRGSAEGQRGKPTLDIQEGNSGEAF